MIPRIGSGLRHHTPQAWRVGYSGRSRNEELQNAAIDDLLLDIEQGDIDINGVDWDGTSLLTLALRGWKENNISRAFWNQTPTQRRLQYPLPGESWKQNGDVDMPWQRPAAAMVSLGADPFIDWPAPGQSPWAAAHQSESGVEELPKCPFFQAVRSGAWGVLEQMLRHPQCPPASALDAIRMSSGRGLLGVAAATKDDTLLALLLKQGLDTECLDAQGCTPLFHAQDLAQVKALLEAGANPGHINAHGDNAPAFWATHLKSASPLVNVWESYAAGAQADGRMVVQSLRANSVSGFRSALKASGWDIASPVTQANGAQRLLPHAARVMLETMSGPSALPVRVVSHLLEPAFKEAVWTAEEKAWAACALEVCLGLAARSWDYTATTRAQAKELLNGLLADKEVVAHMPGAFTGLVAALPADHHRLPHVWEGWLKSLTTSTNANKWESLATVWRQPAKALKDLSDENVAGECLIAWTASRSALLPSSNALIGLLALRAGTWIAKDRRADFDAKWLSAWPFTGGVLDASLPWMQSWMNNQSEAETAPFRKLLLEQEFEVAPSVKGPRL